VPRQPIANRYICVTCHAKPYKSAFLDPAVAIAHIKTCNGPLVVVGATDPPSKDLGNCKPGDILVFEGATIHMDGRTGQIGFPENDVNP
jgi:hypothetical protein